MKYCFSKHFLKAFHVFNSSPKNESKSHKKSTVKFKKLKQKKKRFDGNNELREKQKILVLELKNEVQLKLKINYR